MYYPSILVTVSKKNCNYFNSNKKRQPEKAAVFYVYQNCQTLLRCTLIAVLTVNCNAFYLLKSTEFLIFKKTLAYLFS